MKEFFKMTLATLLGLFVFGIVSFFISFSMIGALASLGETTPVMPREGVLKLDMSKIILQEQTQEADPLQMLQSQEVITPIGIYSAVSAIKAAASDPAIRFIYMLPDATSAGISHLEELRRALADFRQSGKPVVSFMENPSNAGLYLASVSDKIFLSSYEGGMNTVTGLSSQMLFLKDLLDKIGVNVQLIRHGKYKSAGEMYIRNSASQANKEQYTQMISSMWGSIASEIASSRGISVESLNSLIDKLQLNRPEDFLNSGLVDEIVTKDELHQRLCNLFVTNDYRDIKAISIADYAKLKNTMNYKAANQVAVVYANGEIVDAEDFENIEGDRFAKIISDLRRNDQVKAVVLRVNSPGGSVFASEKIRAELELLGKEKTLVASYGDYAASGGYWISAGCEKIFSNAPTLTGSIGVFSMIPDFSKVVRDKVHVGVTTINSNKHSDMYSLMRPLDAEETAYMQASVEDIYEKFTGIVAEARDMDVDEVDAIAQGRVWTGSDALGIGLVDEIGTLEDAINYAAVSIEGVTSSSDVLIQEYPAPMTTFQMLLESFSNTQDQEIFSGTPFEKVEMAFRSWTSADAGKVYARMPYIFDIK